MSAMDGFILVACVALGWVSMCRMNAVKPGVTRVAFQLRYLLVFAGAFCAGLSPWLFPQNKDVGVLILVVCLVVSQVLTSHDWGEGAPEYTNRRCKR